MEEKEIKLTELKTAFMNQHPLRNELSQEDWQRIQHAYDTECYDTVSTEEIEAANDVFYDAIAGLSQTHLGTTTLQ